MDCRQFLQVFTDWIAQQQGAVEAHIVTNRANDKLCTYITATLIQAQSGPLERWMSGDGQQYFGDRVTANGQPFNVNAPDQVGVLIAAVYDPLHNVNTNYLILTLHTWGDAQINFQLECGDEGLLIGRGNDGVGNIDLLVSLSDVMRPG